MTVTRASAILAVLLAAAAPSATPFAHAQQNGVPHDPLDRLRSTMVEESNGRDDIPAHKRIAVYASVEGGVRFVLDLAHEPPLIKFDGDGEIYALKAVAATRGDTIFKRDDGRVVLRRTMLGGVTAFPEDGHRGAPVLFKREAEPLLLPAASRDDIYAIAADMKQEIKARAGREIECNPFAYGPSSEISERILADALRVAQTAILESLRSHKIAAELRETVFIEAPTPSAEFEDGVLTVRYSADAGPAGRPSSVAIAKALKAHNHAGK